MKTHLLSNVIKEDASYYMVIEFSTYSYELYDYILNDIREGNFPDEKKFIDIDYIHEFKDDAGNLNPGFSFKFLITDDSSLRKTIIKINNYISVVLHKFKTEKESFSAIKDKYIEIANSILKPQKGD